MYSSAIPLLYLSGFFLCIILYWTDKILLLRFNSTPPKFDLKLATRSRKIMEFAVLLHIWVALYMLSNPNILVPDTKSAFELKSTKTIMPAKSKETETQAKIGKN